MRGSPTRVSCKPLFQKLDILTMPSQYILFLMMFLVNNFHYCPFKSSVQEINIREKIQLCKPIANFVSHQRGEYYVSVKIFNALPAPI